MRDAAESLPSFARNQFRGTISEIARTGALTRATVEVEAASGASGAPFIAPLTTRSAQELAPRAGSEVWASLKAMAVHLY